MSFAGGQELFTSQVEQQWIMDYGTIYYCNSFSSVINANQVRLEN